MNKNRFCTTYKPNNITVKKFESLGFSRLPDCLHKNYSYVTEIIIDTQTKTFWCLDKVCFGNLIITIKDQFEADVTMIEVDDLVFSEAKEVDLSNEPLPKKPHKAIGTEEITLLDYFAAKAMQGELASQGINDVFDHKYISERAYMIAREMMITRANSQSTDSNK